MNRKFHVVTTAAVIAAVAVIMVNSWGLSDELDFGAGAYYYADMPGFEQWFDKAFYTSYMPLWVYATLFFLWGAVAYRLWVILDRNGDKNV